MRIADVSDIDDKVLGQGSQMLITVSGEGFLKGFTEMIGRLTMKKGSRVLLVSTVWSANALSRRIGMNKLPRGSIRVIDTYSLSLGSNNISNPDFIFLPTPVPLESILVEVERQIRSEGEKVNYLVLDSLTFMRRYHTPGQLSEFFHFLLNRMLEEEVSVIIFDQETDRGDPTRDLLISIMDKSVDIKGGDRE